MALGNCCANHATPLYQQKLVLTSLKIGGRPVGIVLLRTNGYGVWKTGYLTTEQSKGNSSLEDWLPGNRAVQRQHQKALLFGLPRVYIKGDTTGRENDPTSLQFLVRTYTKA
jgi:hypothetical protein